ncbi:hypothetical protein [Ensifer aridi]|uniref:hypothetical protein n=1 Tax=Ensifer aridi TaxID=1708715 RepID=UPI001555511D|nr:hypothetical protein [Ensifer aridi]
MEHVDTWSEYAIVYSNYAAFLAALLLAVWKAVKRRFSPYWTIALSLLVLGPAVLLSPWYSDIPVRHWDAVANAGQWMLLAGMLAVIGGCVADALRARSRS